MSEFYKKEDENEGYLELWTGPMYSGKTSKILELYKQFTFCGITNCVINYEEDNRYPNSETHLSSHDQIMIPCIRSKTLTEIADIIGKTSRKDTILNGKYADKFNESTVILINEGQFFGDIVEWVRTAVDVYNKQVYICGLDGDFERKSFTGDWLDLTRYCDKISKMHSFCNKCKKKPAIFSHRLVYDTAQKVIGADNYVPLCRKCFLKENETKH
jgi:thymidine kinase